MKKSYKIIFLGNTSVGKTMLIYRYISDGFTFSEPTIGIDFFSSTMEIEGKNVRLQLWDTAGQERYKSIITPYIRDSFLAIIVYAVNDRNSFKQLKYWIDLYTNKNNYKNFKILIVANKKDLRTSKNGKGDTEEFIDDQEGRDFAQKNNAAFCTASALDKKDIEELISGIKGAISSDIAENPEYEDKDGANVLNAKQNNSFCC